MKGKCKIQYKISQVSIIFTSKFSNLKKTAIHQSSHQHENLLAQCPFPVFTKTAFFPSNVSVRTKMQGNTPIARISQTPDCIDEYKRALAKLFAPPHNNSEQSIEHDNYT